MNTNSCKQSKSWVPKIFRNKNVNNYEILNSNVIPKHPICPECHQIIKCKKKEGFKAEIIGCPKASFGSTYYRLSQDRNHTIKSYRDRSIH